MNDKTEEEKESPTLYMLFPISPKRWRELNSIDIYK